LPVGQLHCAEGTLHCDSTSFAEGNFIRLCPQNEVRLDSRNEVSGWDAAERSYVLRT